MNHSLFAIFGNPVSHSKSPLMHNLTFKALQEYACYGRYLLEDGEWLRESFFSLGLKGVNVTVPHKEAAYRACDVLDDFALKVGAVNTIVEREGKLYGYNTDAPGFLKAIAGFGAKKVLFIGAGGTAQATSAILREEGYEVVLLNRSAGRLEKFRSEGFEVYTFEDFVPSAYDLVINMTSAGLEEETLPAPREILEALLLQTKACVDVIYGKETPFLKLAKAYGKPTKDGSDMLLYQGVIAFTHFTEGKYGFDEVLPHMQRAFDFAE